ncbi:MAG: glycosyltransferase family 2 protein [Oscillospiraceae bacterium]|nr:glycosyltransferase family 2 protein [Oscillospiraceae bacterium]MBQ4538959.1 glycosyltransferase family 2 protein [Oscillospiraceae bacterium]
MSKTLYIVVPCYNEQEVLPETSRRLLEKIEFLLQKQKINDKSRILFVDDGSRDATWSIISDLIESNEYFAGVKLSRNKGHQNALLAGLATAKDRCDAAISLDADLQDDIEAIDEMVDNFIDGCDIVYGVRSSRKTDTAFKRTTAKGFYRFMRLLGVDIIDDHADYRLMSKRALEALLQFEESNLFLRGIVPQIGFKSAIVTYERHERFAGESKYPLKKMLMFAFDGITSFSVKPIRFVTLAGALIFGVSMLAMVILLLQKLMGYTVQGWTTLMGSIWALGGIQLLSLGIIGEYIGKIYQETKRRPKFIIDKIEIK